MTKRITLSSGDYINLSDIPNERVFNLVKKCFINAGFNDCGGKYAQWKNAQDYPSFSIGTCIDSAYYMQFSGIHKRQLSLSDVFNSVNGGFCWNDFEYIHMYDDHILYGGTKYPSNPPPLVSIKRIPEAPEAIISSKVSQWWDYDKVCAVGFPEKGEVVLYLGVEYEVLKTGTNNSGCHIVLLCLNESLPDPDEIGWVTLAEIKPLDCKTSKQIAVDKAFACLSEFRSAEQVLGELYDKGLLKGGE